MTLKEIWKSLKDQGYESDKGSVHSYLEVYEEIFSPYRKTAKNILEIGLFKGDSLRMWVEYFEGDVYGIDCDEKPVGGMGDLTAVIAEGFRIVIGDATDSEMLSRVFDGLKFDVVIDDAQHNLEQQLEIYKVMKPYLAENAIYIIEDCQNIDQDRSTFEQIDVDKAVTIVDRRSAKGRYDDILIVIK